MFESVYSHCLDQHVKILEYSVYVEQRSLRKRNKLFRSMLKGRSEFEFERKFVSRIESRENFVKSNLNNEKKTKKEYLSSQGKYIKGVDGVTKKNFVLFFT